MGHRRGKNLEMEGGPELALCLAGALDARGCVVGDAAQGLEQNVQCADLEVGSQAFQTKATRHLKARLLPGSPGLVQTSVHYTWKS